MKLFFHDSHAYPGCLVDVIDGIPIEGTMQEAVAVFSDGATTSASCDFLGAEDIEVRVRMYITAAGTKIPTKNWLIRRETGKWKVKRRMRVHS